MKLARSTFVYLKPRGSLATKKDWAQCGTCKMFLADHNVCSLLGKDFKVDEDDACCEYTPGGPADESEMEHVTAAFTPEEVGFVSDTQVRCQNCIAFDGSSKCQFYQRLNRVFPSLFDLDETVEPLACCNAWRPKKG